jgi:putative oxidoreductase
VEQLVFALRLGIGALLLAAGILKAHDGSAAVASSIAAYRLLPPFPVAALATFLPYFEIFLGLYLVAGLLTRIAAWVAAVQFVVFAAAVASLVVRRIPADCGCFGSGVATPPSWGHVALDVLLAALCVLIARYAPGIFAVDRVLGSSGSGQAKAES